jgi:hypothetical protein
MLNSWVLVGAMRGREGALTKAAAVRKNWRDDEKLGMYVAMLCNTTSEVCRTWGIAIGDWRHKPAVMRSAIGVSPRLHESDMLHRGARTRWGAVGNDDLICTITQRHTTEER